MNTVLSNRADIVGNDIRRQARPGARSTLRSTVRRLVAGSLAAGALALTAAPAMANQILNGGFETGDFTGWTLGGDTSFTGVQCSGDPTIVAEGRCAAFLGASGTNGTLMQTFATLPGAHYFLSFAIKYDGGAPSNFSAAINGQQLYATINPTLSDLQRLTFLFDPTTAFSTLMFTFRDDPGFQALDAINVAAIPEPAGVLLLGIGMAALATARGRRALARRPRMRGGANVR